MGFDVSELRALERDLEAGAAKVRPLAERIVAKSARDIEATAKVNAPVDTGYLENSISSDIGGLDAEIGPTASYADYVEAGTSKMAAQPYMGPAVDQHEPAFVNAIGQAGAKIL